MILKSYNFKSKLYDSFDPTINSMVLEMNSFYEEKVKCASDEKQLIGACYIYINFAPRIAQVLKKHLLKNGLVIGKKLYKDIRNKRF